MPLHDELYLSPGLNISPSAKHEITREESQENQNGTLLLSQFGLLVTLNLQLFGMITAYKMMELKRNLSVAAYLSARRICIDRKRRYLQARGIHGFPESLVLFNPGCIEVVVLIFHMSFEICEKANTILYFIAFIPLKMLLLLLLENKITAHVQAGPKFRFDYTKLFSGFPQAHWARLKTGLGFNPG